MSASPAGIRFLEYKHPATGKAITRIEFRDWFIDVDPAGTVIIPAQQITKQNSGDFAACLAAARHYATELQQDTPLARRPAQAYDPELPPVPRPSARTLASILTAAKHVAAERWTSGTCDIYVCTQTAWEDTNINVPYTSVLSALRRALPSYKAANLSAVNDQARGRADIVAFYDHAIALLQPPVAIEGAA